MTVVVQESARSQFDKLREQCDEIDKLIFPLRLEMNAILEGKKVMTFAEGTARIAELRKGIVALNKRKAPVAQKQAEVAKRAPFNRGVIYIRA